MFSTRSNSLTHKRFVHKMQRRNRCSFKKLTLTFLLMLWQRCDSQVSRGEASEPPGGLGGDDGAFFALRSCHQLLRADAGEFFSPDYLCSNPPLWCNWTIQVDPGKRVHLHLEDLTPDDACHLKQDQVHVDEPAGPFRGHKLLQRCWREAKFTSSSDTLYVVLLIGGWPSPAPYRGFHGRFQAFGPPVVYNPPEGLADGDGGAQPPLDRGVIMSSDHTYDDYDQDLTMTTGPPRAGEGDAAAQVDENHRPASENYTHIHPLTPAPATPESTQGTSRLGRGAAQTSDLGPQTSVRSEGPADPPAAPEQQSDVQTRKPEPATSATPAGPQRTEDAGGEESAGDENWTEVNRVPDQLPSRSEDPGPEPGGTEPTQHHPNVVELLSDHRGSVNMRNYSDVPHLPGDHLLEVAVEVNLNLDLDESTWNHRARSLLLSVKALINQKLKDLHPLLSMSSKRVKRLSAGVLYILWLQIGQGPGSPHVYRLVRSTLQGLVAKDVGVTGNQGGLVITSVSTADVNECGTQLVLCDVNADCENHFGSYSCRCRPGFQDRSRLGSGGTVCVDVEAAGCAPGPSAETRAVYVLFFLLSALVLMLVAAAGLLYRRHHRGAFLVRCRSGNSVSPPDTNNNNNHHYHGDSYSSPVDSDLPPPPPVRGFRDGWPQVKERRPAVDVPLLRFSPLPPDGYEPPQEGGKT